MSITRSPERYAPPRYGYADLARFMAMMAGDEKHDPSSTSTLDVIWILYDRVLRVSPDRRGDPDRDRFLLSKGHGPMAYYAVLAVRGFVPAEALATYGRFDSILGHHPDRLLVPGVEISSGSLGHGLPIAVGLALGLRARRSPARVWCLLGDAELEEGSNHEAIALAGRLGIGSLAAIVIDNGSSSHGWPGGIGSRFSIEGWDEVAADGTDHADIERALTADHPDRPLVVVAHTRARS